MTASAARWRRSTSSRSGMRLWTGGFLSRSRELLRRAPGKDGVRCGSRRVSMWSCRSARRGVSLLREARPSKRPWMRRVGGYGTSLLAFR
ncbi:hypothetical protein CH063_05725 [Colletotrichum higginsianum]|uniref:Uncharacterized protein n=1 Tax=Colletotrichum higginsianum (strain IMI 349063) TaxID=759273 RepID=H1V011_COLHI|nr:hypothetical protein CH063_05725 [Colletotrichum higginsianum]